MSNEPALLLLAFGNEKILIDFLFCSAALQILPGWNFLRPPFHDTADIFIAV
jgi:hypothetical protein